MTNSSEVKKSEKERVEELGKNWSYNQGFHSKMIALIDRSLRAFYTGGSCLVLGPSEGGEQERTLLEKYDSVVFVDGSSRVLQELEKMFPGQRYIHSLFEDITFSESFDTIVMMHILEHVETPIDILKKYSQYLKEDGQIIISVPNAFSFHRMLGVKMGLLEEEHELHQGDYDAGHRRVYDMSSLRDDVETAGLSIVEDGGIFFKLFSYIRWRTFLMSKLRVCIC
jgi:2-polyprenyl-3-methyl-5-hydroxy-6-metoxy-1,4-benzoquinol methylase